VEPPYSRVVKHENWMNRKIHVQFVEDGAGVIPPCYSTSFAEEIKGKFFKHFRPVDPVMRSLDTEIILQFVTDEGSKQTIDIDTPRFVFPKNIAEVQDFIQFVNEENGADRKRYIFIRL